MVVSIDQKINACIDYINQGFEVIRLHGWVDAVGKCSCMRENCQSQGKHPNTRHGAKDATSDEHVIRQWLNDEPHSNIGICPNEDVIIIDIDPKNGGENTWGEWQAEFGEIAETPKQRTGSGGWHYLLRIPAGIKVKNTANKVGEGIDVRSHGGLIVAAPSVTNKGPYEWVVPFTEPIADCPGWLLDKIRETKGVREESCVDVKPTTPSSFTWSDGANDFPSHPGAKQGERPSRHDELCRLIGIHVARGDSLRSIESMAIEWSGKCDPPMEDAKVLKAVRSIHAKDEGINAGIDSQISDFQAQKQDAYPHDPVIDSQISGFQAQTQDHEPDSLHVDGGYGGVQSDDEDGLPVLHPDAYTGLAGRIVKAIEPETEADPVAVLMTLLNAFGNVVSHGAYAGVGATRHHANLFTVIVGDTASRKGESLSVVKWLMAGASPGWHDNHIGYGLSSGEGLIERVQDDPLDRLENLDPCKILWAVETEFNKLLQVKGREGNTLNANIRNAWDGVPLESMTKTKGGKYPPSKASCHHISILGHITPNELVDGVKNVDISNGFVNRFLWCQVRRARFLPEGGDIEVLNPFIDPLKMAIMKARNIGKCWRDDGAKALWAEAYQDLSTGEDHQGRGEAQTLRLSLIYALLDGTQVISVEHLRAALAVWRYCQESSNLIFGNKQDQSLSHRLLDAIVKNPGVSRSQLRQMISSNERKQLGSTLSGLRTKRLAYSKSIGAGRAATETWYPGDEPSPKPLAPTLSWTWGDDGGDDRPHEPMIKVQTSSVQSQKFEAIPHEPMIKVQTSSVQSQKFEAIPHEPMIKVQTSSVQAQTQDHEPDSPHADEGRGLPHLAAIEENLRLIRESEVISDEQFLREIQEVMGDDE